MNTLGKRHDQSNRNKDEKRVIPSVFLSKESEIPLSRALIMAAIAHPLIVLIIWLILFILANLGIDLSLFPKPEPKIKDIEFVLVNNPEQTPLNKKTKYRSDKNSRAGGKHDPTKPVSAPEPQAATSAPQKAMPELAPKQQSKAVQRAPQKQSQRATKTQAQTKQQSQHQSQSEVPVPPRPAPTQAFAPPKMKKFNAFSVPIPSGKAPKTMIPKGGPVTSGPIGDGSGSSSPGPLMSNNGFSGSSKARSASGRSYGGGNAGNPSPGNPNGRPGIDAYREPDFGPYMRELTRRIKRNWDPKGNESKKVVLDFKVSRDGRLLSLSVQRSSGSPEADRAAKSAVELSAPFKQLPPEFKGNEISIQFTFDYTVNSINYRRY